MMISSIWSVDSPNFPIDYKFHADFRDCGRDWIGAEPADRNRSAVMAVKIVAFVTVKPGEDDAFAAAAGICAAASRAEPGVLQYELWRETEGERRFVFDELYVDEAAIQHHRDSAHYKAFGLAARTLATARPEIIVADAIDLAD
jgi:quinol monooxygenase YgiN